MDSTENEVEGLQDQVCALAAALASSTMKGDRQSWNALLHQAHYGSHICEYYVSIINLMGSIKANVSRNLDLANVYLTKCLPWFQSQSLNNKHCQNCLGYLFSIGHGVQKNIHEAYRLQKLAADQGLASAQGNIAVRLLNGEGVEKNEIEAYRYFKLAADQSHVSSQFALAVRYHSAAESEIDNHINKAFKYFKSAADAGHVQAQHTVASMLLAGEGDIVPGEVEEVEQADRLALAIHYYQLAAEGGSAPAQYGLGLRYAQGEGVEQDHAEAYHFFRLAADQGDVDAQLIVGEMLLGGAGVQMNQLLGMRYLQMAAGQGDLQAIKLFSQSMSTMTMTNSTPESQPTPPL